ncbi:hypothetical protein [Streptomyces sp. NPDC048191]|uniref:hypothetical protein n=1 Tax=Streptomyces sp. NPDC048191 TaxID=3155484 RepID=UPI0033E9919D
MPTAPVAVAADALSFLVSALLIGPLPASGPATVGSAPPPRLLHSARQGLVQVLRHPVLRAGLGCAATVNFLPAVSRLIGVGRGVVVGAVLFPLPLALVWAADGPLWVRAGVPAVMEFLSSVGVMLFDVNLNSLTTTVTSDELRSRVAGAWATVNYGVRPLGALAGGGLAGLVGLRGTITVSAVGGALCVLWLLWSPIPAMRTLPMEAPAPARPAVSP